VKEQEQGFRRIVLPGVLLVLVAWVTSGIGDDGSRRVIAAAAVLLACLTVGTLLVVTHRLRSVEHDLRRLTGRWEELAATDQLTGLGNRTRLLEDLQLLIARGSRYGHSFGLVLFELPEAVDADELQVAAELLAAEARSADSCYRIADNRLVALLAEQDLLGAGLAAGRIGRALRESGFEEVRQGVSGFSPWLEGGASAVLREAERDLRPVDDPPPEDPVTGHP
jgi:GGDEF domain-containing protein